MRALFVLLLALALSGCGYNTIQEKDEAVSAAWSQVQNVYKRRADLVPGLVATVKGYAQQEERVLIGVTEARAKVGQVTVDPTNAASLAEYQKAQGDLSQALARLMVVVEQYPNLKSDQAFLNLQTQLEGTENRITVERQRYIAAVQDYNTTIRRFPVNLTAGMFGYEVKPNFAADAALAEPPVVDFTPAPAAAAPAPSPVPLVPAPASPAAPSDTIQVLPAPASKAPPPPVPNPSQAGMPEPVPDQMQPPSRQP